MHGEKNDGGGGGGQNAPPPNGIRVKYQISQIDQNGYSPFCDETLHIYRCVHLTLAMRARG